LFFVYELFEYFDYMFIAYLTQSPPFLILGWNLIFDGAEYDGLS